jgi:mono/diheme cytochrome c family protein
MSDELKPDAELSAANSPVPVWIITLMLVLLFFGAIYFDRNSGWFDQQVYSPYASSQNLALYQPKSGEAALFAHAKTVYETVCGTCHGNDGIGKPNQAPPLAGSEWIARDIQTFVRIPQAGLNGPIQVNGQNWNLSMAPMGAGLSDADLAGVLSYIRQSWGNKGGAVSADDVKAARTFISGNAPSAAELARMTPVERGRLVFQKYGCYQCHGPDAKGGVANPNAKTAELVPGLINVANGYTKDELTAFIKRGERVIPRLNPAGPEPPHFMPKWDPIISDAEIKDLAEFLFSLKPKDQDVGF